MMRTDQNGTHAETEIRKHLFSFLLYLLVFLCTIRHISVLLFSLGTLLYFYVGFCTPG